MQDTALYQYLQGLKSAWTVSRVNLDVNGVKASLNLRRFKRRTFWQNSPLEPGGSHAPIEVHGDPQLCRF